MKRKKWLFPVLMVLMFYSISTAHAQLRFGVKGGANIATVKFNKDVLKSENVTGFHIGPIVEYMPKVGLGVDLALLFSQKGLSVDAIDEKYVSNYLEIPVNLKMKIGLPLVSPYFAAGPYMSFLIGGDKELIDVVDYGGNIIERIKTKNFGAGLNFTVGAEVLNRIQVGLTYNWGLTNHFNTFKANDLNSYKGKAHTWMISAAVFL